MILHDQITRLRAPLVSDGYGNGKPDWNSPASAEYLVHWSAKSTAEVVGDEPQTSTRVYIIGTPDLDLVETDRVTGPDGLMYEVDGEVMRSYRRGQVHHVRAFLRRIAISS